MLIGGSSQGLAIENVAVKKLSHRFTNSKGRTEFMYYHRIIVNFKKLLTGNTFFLHFLVNIPQDGSDLAIYPKNFKGVYIIAYGIMGKVSNIDPDKVYDYHTSFQEQKTQVVYNVDINANNKKILNIALDKSQSTSAATVGMVKDLFPFIKNHVYNQYFETFYDLTLASNYRLRKGRYGIVISILGKDSFFLSMPNNRTIDDVRRDGLNISNYTIRFYPDNFTNYTLCIVFYHWYNRDFSLVKKNPDNRLTLTEISYNYRTKKVDLRNISSNPENFTMPRSLDGKRIVLWLAESTNATKAIISGYSSTLTLTNSDKNTKQIFDFTIADGVMNKILFSPNFYDIDSISFHTVMLQEKLNGSYIF